MFRVEESSSIATVFMEHGKVNAMSVEFCEGLTEYLGDLGQRDSIRGVILTGTTAVFSAGVDLKRLVREPVAYVDAFLPSIRRLFLSALTFPKPLISAIQGHALAGGCVLASAGDYRLLMEGAKIGMPELRVGLALPAEGIEIFRYAVAPQFLTRVVTSGVSFSGTEALAAGLCDEVVPPDQLQVRATAVAQEYAQIPADVFRLTKEQIRQPVLQRIRENEAAFGDRIEALWRDAAIRDAVAKYVRERL